MLYHTVCVVINTWLCVLCVRFNGVNVVRKKSFFHRYSVIATAVMALTPSVAFASVASSISSNTISVGSSVTGSGCCPCNADNGEFATSEDLGDVLSNVTQAVLTVGEVLNTGQTQQMQAMQTLDNQYLQEEMLHKKQNAVAEVALHEQLESGSSFPEENGALLNGCTASSVFQSISAGMANSRSLAGNLTAGLAAYNNSSTGGLAAIQSIADEPAISLNSVSLFNPASNHASTENTAQYVATITNPVPAVKITQTQKKNPAGVMVQAVKHATLAKLSASQSALSQIAAWNTPTIQLSSTFASTTGVTVPASATNSNGDISSNQMMALMAGSRYASSKWQDKISVDSQVGAVRTLVQMEAARLELHWQMLRMDEHLVQISADEYAHSAVTPLVNQENEMAGNAMSQQNSSLASSSTSAKTSGAS